MVEFKHLNNCGNCGGNLSKTGDKYICDACPEETFNSPVCGTSAFVFREDETLLAIRGQEPRKGWYGNVGGFTNYMEQPEDALRREFKEETGVDVLSIELFDAHTQKYTENQSVVDMMHLVELEDPYVEMIASDDVAELVWVKVSEVDSLQMHPHKKAGVKKAYELHKKRLS